MLLGKSDSCPGYSVDSQAPPVLDGTPPWPFGLGVERLRKCSDEVVNSDFMLGVWGWLLETTRMEDFIRKLWSGDGQMRSCNTGKTSVQFRGTCCDLHPCAGPAQHPNNMSPICVQKPNHSAVCSQKTLAQA